VSTTVVVNDVLLSSIAGDGVELDAELAPKAPPKLPRFN
jgi:hypothetical protein